ncbi:MAG: N-acetylmuramic acid 6-phosphate etherase [Candidatus Acidiferrales bacterium]
MPRQTERRNPRTRGIDLRSTLGVVRAMNREDARVAPAVRRALPAIARAVDAIVKSLRGGGRLLYAGAGTSGRLAALDAAECPPTFGTPSGMIQAILAGGRRALTEASEGAEDSAARGAKDLARRKVSTRDVVVGIAASGTTAYVLGALGMARRRGAQTIGIACNRGTPVLRAAKIPILVETGPEAIAGSTRLKAGTAQKMVLNLLSTAAMVRLGRVYDNWMVGVALTNRKLRRRGLRILEEATGASAPEATRAMRQSRHDLRVAIVMLEAKIGASEARLRLIGAQGDLRRAIHSAKLRGAVVRALRA